jgi:uncharacterized lipoprotein YbaY
MKLKLTILRADGDPLPQGSSVNVEARDTSLADAPAISLKRIRVAVPRTGRTMTLQTGVELTSVPDGTTVWAHVDVDGDGRVSKGDYISMESYPVTLGTVQDLTIRVKEVK